MRFLTAETMVTVLPAVAPRAPSSCYRQQAGNNDATGNKPATNPQQAGIAPRNSQDQGSDLNSDLHPSSPGNQTGARVSEPPPVFVGMPLAAKGATWDVPVDLDAELAKAFPAIDRQAEYQHAKAWLVVTPVKRKTAKGMPRFLLNWFETAQNRGGAARANAAPRRDTRCAFHLNWNNHRRKPPGGWYASCPECKEAQAALGTRQGDPTPAADALAATERKVRELREAAEKTWTPDQLAEMRASRAQKTREPADPRPPPLSASSAATPAARPGGSSVDGPGTPAGYPGVVSTGGGA